MSEKNIRIRRAQHDKENPYYFACRATSQNKSLSYEALGLLHYVLSKPDNWIVQPSDLERVGCKRNRVYKLLNELISLGYIERIYNRDSRGRVESVDYITHEAPFTESPLPEKQEMDLQEMETQHTTEEREEEKRESTSIAPKARKARPLFDLIAKESFNITDGQILGNGGRIGKVESWCKKHDVVPDELEKFYPWYDRNNTGASRPRDVEKFAEHFLAFREEMTHRNPAWPAGYIPVAERTHPLQFVELVNDNR